MSVIPQQETAVAWTGNSSLTALAALPPPAMRPLAPDPSKLRYKSSAAAHISRCSFLTSQLPTFPRLPSLTALPRTHRDPALITCAMPPRILECPCSGDKSPSDLTTAPWVPLPSPLAGITVWTSELTILVQLNSASPMLYSPAVPRAPPSSPVPPTPNRLSAVLQALCSGSTSLLTALAPTPESFGRPDPQ